MKPYRLLVLLLVTGLSFTISSCASYRWVHPSKNVNEFNEDNSFCMQQATQAYPPVLQYSTIRGYQAPSTTNCTNFNGIINCTTTPGYTTPSTTYSSDRNQDNRDAAHGSCMNARGWTLQEVKSAPQSSTRRPATTSTPPQAGNVKDGFDALNRKAYQTALKIFRPLAEQGDALAQNNLGFMYNRGYGVLQDYAEAVKWYTKSAEQGCALGLAGLGDMYSRGWGVSQDYAEGYKWYILSISNSPDKDARDRIIKARDILAAKMTPAQIAEAQRLATEWKPTGK